MHTRILQLNKIKLILLSITLYIVGCKTADVTYINYPPPLAYDEVIFPQANFSKLDTAYSDTSRTRNTNHLIVYPVIPTTLGGIGTLMGANLQTDLFLLTISDTATSVHLILNDTTASNVVTPLFTVTGTTITGYKSDTIINVYALNTTLPGVMPKPDASFISTLTIPSGIPTAVQVVYRNGIQTTLAVGSISGSSFNDVPQDFLRLLTLGNNELASTSKTDILKGWHIVLLSSIEASSGGITDNTNRITDQMRKSISGVFTYFPDGYYTFISAVDSSYNQLGWYKIAMVNNVPAGIVYETSKSGPNFTDPPQFPRPFPQVYSGYGIWGLSTTSFYPIIRIDLTRQAVLTTVPVTY